MKALARSALVLLLPLASCQPSQAIKSAERGDREGVRQALNEEQLSRQRTVDLARSSLGYDVRQASGHEGRRLINGFSPCALELEGALQQRAKKRDAVGGEAALVLFEHGLYRGPKVKRFAKDPEGAWRALAARGTAGDHEPRVLFFLDDDERVRRAALAAALEASDEADIPALLEASRVDPDGLTRSRAIQALGRIGGERVFTALLDRYQNAEEPLRLAIVDAYASPNLLHHGGLTALLHLAESETGFPALSAAHLLTRQTGTDRETGLAKLLHFARNGTTQEKRLALRLMPTDAEDTLNALTQATKSDDAEVAVIAWSRLLGGESHRHEAELALLKIAEQPGDLAYQAKAALAAAGSSSSRDLFVGDLKAKQAEIRQVAGYGLVRLGHFVDVAPLLADESAEVRHAVGCRLLSASADPTH